MIVICDQDNHRIRGYLPSQGNVITIAGNGEEWNIDGPALQSSFQHPYDICIDGNGVMIASQAGEATLRVIENGNVSTFNSDQDLSGRALITRDGRIIISNYYDSYVITIVNSNLKGE